MAEDTYDPKFDRRLHTILDRLTRKARQELMPTFSTFNLKGFAITRNEEGDYSWRYEFDSAWSSPELKYMEKESVF